MRKITLLYKQPTIKWGLMTCIALAILIHGCKKDGLTNNTSSVNKSNPDDINIETALNIARTFQVPASNKIDPPINKSVQNASLNKNQITRVLSAAPTSVQDIQDFSKKIIASTFTYKDHDSNIAMYVINYQGGGFLIISATQKEHPILAYSYTDNYPVDIKNSNHPANLWANGCSEKINAVRKNKIKNSDSLTIKAEWGKYISVVNRTFKVIPYAPTCPNGHYDFTTHQCVTCPTGYTWDGKVCQPPPPCQVPIVIGPFLKTTWNQGCGFNNYTPTPDPDINNCNHMPAGCEAVAIGQILKYWQKGTVWLMPTSPGVNGTYGTQTYNYSDATMPLTSGSNETSRLLRDIGNAIGMSYNSSNKGGSSSSPNHPSFFKSAGFSSSGLEQSYSTNDILAEMTYGRPCLLGGFTYALLPWNAEGHEWICDGLQATPYTCYPTYWAGYSNIRVHLNWGWGGYCNGWYAPGSWIPIDDKGNNPGGLRFLYNLDEVINIFNGSGVQNGNN